MRFKNYIFDLGKVIVNYDPEIMTSAYVADKNDIDIIKDVLFDRLYWDKLDDGSISDNELMENVCERLPEKYHDVAHKIYDNWFCNMPIIEKTRELISDIKKGGGKLYLLSNISVGFAENYAAASEIKQILDMFDGLVFSGPLGIAKPDEKIFRYILDKYSLIPEESCFIDDNIDNINSAKKININTFHFSEDKFDEIKKCIM